MSQSYKEPDISCGIHSLSGGDNAAQLTGQSVTLDTPC